MLAQPQQLSPEVCIPGDIHRGWQANVYCAFDIRTQFIVSAGNRYLSELADVYRRVFNDIQSVEAKWTQQGARNLIQFHVQTPGCNLALFNQTEEKIVGGFLSNIVPSAHGWKLSTWDIFVDPTYNKGSKIGQDLYTTSMIEADNICLRNHGSGITSSYSTTYKKSTGHRRMWERRGYVLSSLFNLTSRDILRYEKSSQRASVEVKHAQPEDIEQIANFISHSDTVTSDGQKWETTHARNYTDFMLRYHQSTFVVAKKNSKIVAVGSVNILPTRSEPISDSSLLRPGVTGVEPLCFVSGRCSQEERMNLTRATYARLFQFASGAAMQVWKQGFSSIEIPSQSINFFRTAFPDIKEDDEFLGGTAGPTVMANDFKPNGTHSRVSVVPYRRIDLNSLEA